LRDFDKGDLFLDLYTKDIGMMVCHSLTRKVHYFMPDKDNLFQTNEVEDGKPVYNYNGEKIARYIKIDLAYAKEHMHQRGYEELIKYIIQFDFKKKHGLD